MPIKSDIFELEGERDGTKFGFTLAEVEEERALDFLVDLDLLHANVNKEGEVEDDENAKVDLDGI